MRQEKQGKRKSREECVSHKLTSVCNVGIDKGGGDGVGDGVGDSGVGDGGVGDGVW